MWFIDKRINVICTELKRLITVESKSLEDICYKEGKCLYPSEAESMIGEWRNFDPKTMKWYGPDKHYWFLTEYTVPKEQEGKTLRLLLKTQIDEWDDAKNPQFLLFVNGEETQGLDMNHREVQMTQSAREGEKWKLDIQAYTGSLHGEFNLMIEMQTIDKKIEGLYYDLIVPLWAFGRMKQEDKVRMDIQTVLNNTINLLDLRTPYSHDFYKSVEAATAYINKALYEDMAGYEDVVATCIGHTHIDVAWWWTVEQTKEKVARSFATVLKLMEEYPNYKFMSSQPQLYEFLKKRYPKVYDRIKEKVKEGRWEAEGGMWLEPDTNLTSGESLVRQILYGKRFFKEEFGVDSKVVWLPDVFGYSGALPQIMKKCGIEYFMTTKLAWNQINKMPYDTFLWKGIDGSSVFTHLVTTLDVGQSTDNFFTTYNGRLHPDSIMGGWERYQNKDINHDILISYGYGDGGGGPTREQLETSLRMEKGVKGIPKVRQEFSGTYFEEVYSRTKDNKRLPVWEGELYFEYHRGTYTSMARNKRSNRKCEILMQDLELISLLALERGLTYEQEAMDTMWKTILLNQFHDILPGTSIHEVYEVTKKEYEQIEDQSRGFIQERIGAISGEGNKVTLFNTLGFERDDVIRLPKNTGEALKGEDGRVYPIQELEEDAVVYVEKLPSKGYCSYDVVERRAEEQPFRIEAGRLETPYYIIEIDEKGLFTSIYDKLNEREILQDGQKGNLMRMFEDKPIYYDNWDIDIYHTEKSWDVDQVLKLHWKEVGPVCAVLEIERKESKSFIHQNIIFYAHKRRIDFETYVDWKEHQHLLKVEFPVDIHTDEAVFDIQFGNLTRKVHTNTSWDRARFESCGQKWMDLSEGHYGVSLINDCKYGYSVRNSIMSLTLIKSGIEPNPVADQEEHCFTYSLYPHRGNIRECDTVLEGYCLNYPVWAKKGTSRLPSASFVEVDQKNVMIESVKQAENGKGVIMRVYEYENAKTKANITFGMNQKIVSIYECNLLEEPVGEPLPCTDNSFSFVIKPFEIKTYWGILES